VANVLYFPNLRAAGEAIKNATGTVVTDAGAVDHACLDTFVRNDALNPLFVSSGVSTANILAQDIHNATVTNINASGGAYVVFGAGITIPAGTTFVQISSTCGQPLEVTFAANIGAAAASTKKVYLVQGGAPGTLAFIPGVDNLIFIKSLSLTAITSGYVAVNFIG
jgi:hypothetical protein